MLLDVQLTLFSVERQRQDAFEKTILNFVKHLIPKLSSETS